jgi:hypothetical protein
MIVSEMYELCSGYDKSRRSPRISTVMTPQGTKPTTKDLLYQLEEVRIILFFLSHFVDMKIEFLIQS